VCEIGSIDWLFYKRLGILSTVLAGALTPVECQGLGAGYRRGSHDQAAGPGSRSISSGSEMRRAPDLVYGLMITLLRFGLAITVTA
jgi:hypothetical protein